MSFQIYNTLTRKKEVFKPIKDKEVRMYSCGPTVYWYQHIGNMRAYIFSDLLQRIIEYNGYKVKKIINVTDVGHLTSDADDGKDKMEEAAKKQNMNAKDIADFYFKEFHQDLGKLNIKDPFKWTKATEHISEQIELIKKLEKKGFTYKTSDGVYFDSSKFKEYGKLAKLRIDKLKAGKRIDMGEKKNSTDFALWKFSSGEEKRQQEWDSPWGVGFPGWHIECSAMSMKYLGETFDIHTGGEDHIPIHHTNEIAQSEAATGKKFVNYWLHNGFLTFKGEKVSKSKGGLYTISELEEMGYSALTYRYFCLLTTYRYSLDFSIDNLNSAKNAYERLKRKIEEIRNNKEKGEDKTKEYEKEFLDAINDDLNTPKAVQVVWKMINDLEFDNSKKLKLLYRFDEVLGLSLDKEEKEDIPKEIQNIVDAREQARKNKDWKKSDELRQEIQKLGYSVEDNAKGAIVTKQ